MALHGGIIIDFNDLHKPSVNQLIIKMKKIEKKFILLDALTDALGRSEGQSLNEVKEDLQDEGIDVEASVKSLMESVKMISMTAAKKYSNQSGTNQL